MTTNFSSGIGRIYLNWFIILIFVQINNRQDAESKMTKMNDEVNPHHRRLQHLHVITSSSCKHTNNPSLRWNFSKTSAGWRIKHALIFLSTFLYEKWCSKQHSLYRQFNVFVLIIFQSPQIFTPFFLSWLRLV